MDEEVDKTEERRTYMREYKQKKYNDNPRDILDRNKAYYYKNKFGLDSEMMKKYGTLLPCVAKIKSAVQEFRENNLNLSIEYLTEVLIELQDEDLKRRQRQIQGI